ncbi:MAG: hypothetical protein IJ217_01665 [Clostridia bacterium]|nr:hypothetical protein [Clostridia bacterium]
MNFIGKREFEVTIEEEVFENSTVDVKRLLAYGFVKIGENYMFEKLIYNEDFKAIITVASSGKVSGKVIDLSMDEEFFNFRVKDVVGLFTNSIREAYVDLLTDIKEKCFRFTKEVKSWVVPANPKMFDVISYLEGRDTITWKQPIDAHIGDLVYIYMGSPYSCILYKCMAIRVNFTEYGENAMELKLLQKYEEDRYPLDKLRNLGLKSVRCCRSLPRETAVALIKMDSEEENYE